MTQPPSLSLRPIGTLHTPWRTIAECPKNGRQPDPAPLCTVQVLPEFVDGLRDLEGFSHLILLLLAGSGMRPPSCVHAAVRSCSREGYSPPGRRAGRTRSASRSSRSMASTVPDRLKVRYLDCLDGTPLLDIKPYLPTTDSEPDAAMGWLEPHATRNRNTRGLPEQHRDLVRVIQTPHEDRDAPPPSRPGEAEAAGGDGDQGARWHAGASAGSHAAPVMRVRLQRRRPRRPT